MNELLLFSLSLSTGAFDSVQHDVLHEEKGQKAQVEAFLSLSCPSRSYTYRSPVCAAAAADDGRGRGGGFDRCAFKTLWMKKAVTEAARFGIVHMLQRQFEPQSLLPLGTRQDPHLSVRRRVSAGAGRTVGDRRPVSFRARQKHLGQKPL